AAVIVVAGAWLARTADVIGEKTGLGRTLAGMLLVALGTSLPELAVNCSAALIPAPDLAVGDLLGASLFNLLVLAVLDALYRRPERILSRKASAHALPAVTSILLSAIVLLVLLIDAPSPWVRPAWGTLAVGATYLVCIRLIFFDQQYQMQHRPKQAAVAEAEAASSLTLGGAVGGFLVAALAILIAAPFLAQAADGLAERTGLGGTFVGTVFLALCTTLPEVVATTSAVRMGAYDLAVGNIFGSNCINLCILLPVDLFYAGDLLADAHAAHAVTAAAVIVVTGVAVLGLLYSAERRLWVVEYDAGVMIVLVLAALGLVYHTSGAGP
ncbi:MAG: hypothetical protein WED34_19390, partial [Planctomycetales bacterium]